MGASEPTKACVSSEDLVYEHVLNRQQVPCPSGEQVLKSTITPFE